MTMPSKLAIVLVSALLLLPACRPQPVEARIVAHASNILKFEVDGFALTCSQRPRVFEKTGSDWKEVDQSLLSLGAYFLDGEWYNTRWCDVLVCQPLETPYLARLVRYEKVGERTMPESYGLGQVNEVRSIPLHGPLKITVESYSDKFCEQKQAVEIFIEN